MSETSTPETWADVAVELSDYIAALEQEIEDKKALRAEAIRNAIDGGVKTHGGYGFQVRYKGGDKFVVDPDMLRIEFPEIYQDLHARAVRDIKLKPSRKEVLDELSRIFGEDSAKIAIENCGFRVRTDPIYIMTKEAQE